MRAAVFTAYGGPEQLSVIQIPEPTPKDNEVLIKVHAVSLNDWDWQLLQGSPFINRLMIGLRRPKKQILGSDVAGTVEQVGTAVTRFKPGDQVYGDLSNRWGGFAEYVCAPETSLARKPDEMSFAEAAAIPQAGMLAVQGLIDYGGRRLQPGRRVLINGAGGGVGTIGVQIAAQYGVEMSGVDRAEKLAMLRRLGYQHVIDYAQEDFTRSPEQYDLILDTKTNRPLTDYARALKPHGMYVSVGGNGKIGQVLLLGPLYGAFVRKKFHMVALKLNKDLEYMNRQYLDGNLRPVIDGPFELQDIRRAFEIFAAGRHKGKLIIEVNQS